MDVDELLKKCGDYWGWFVAGAGAISGWAALWVKYWWRISRIFNLVDRLHGQLGSDPAAQIVETLRRLSKDSDILERRQTLLEDLTSCAIYVCGSTGECESVNYRLAELFGLDRADCIGYGWLEGVKPEDRERVHKHWTYCVANRIPYECEYQIRNAKTQQISEVKTRAYPVLTNGQVICYVGSLVPIG